MVKLLEVDSLTLLALVSYTRLTFNPTLRLAHTGRISRRAIMTERGFPLPQTEAESACFSAAANTNQPTSLLKPNL